ncbi:MAG: hypothetical protein M1831_001860 [Alyxoria varia]|nr:MAG: hypothetical protein M1831_001860 [Alyxoria varia]
MRAPNPVSSTTSPTLELSPDDVLVVFAPVLPRSGGSGGAEAEHDPFEHLCKAIGAHHSKVRHVPYVPNLVEYTTYARFLEQGDAFIVVACEASTMLSMAKSNQATSILDHDRRHFHQGQVDFTSMVPRLRSGVHMKRHPDHDAPVILMTIGDSHKLSKSRFDLTGIKATVHVDRASTHHLASVADSLFAGDRNVVKAEPTGVSEDVEVVSRLDNKLEISLTLTGNP